MRACSFLALFVVAASVARADDPPAGAAPPRSGPPAAQAPVPLEEGGAKLEVSPYWVGLLVERAGDALRSQLRLESGVLVLEVLPDSPGAKAGMRQHDIVLSFDGRRLEELADLLQAVGAAEERTVKMAVMREGRQLDVEITPERRPSEDTGERPADVDLALNHDQLARLWLAAKGGGAPLHWFQFGPGLIVERQAGRLEGRLELRIETTGEGPTKIIVRHADQEWSVTEESLDELPPPVRAVVEGALNPPLHLRLDVIAGDSPESNGPALVPTEGQVRRELEQRLNEQLAAERSPLARERSAELRQLRLEQQLEELTKQLIELQKQLQELRARQPK